MKTYRLKYILISGCFVLLITGCKTAKSLQLQTRVESSAVPGQFNDSVPSDSMNFSQMEWKSVFKDDNLIALIDAALTNNQELHILKQEIESVRGEVRAKRGEILPIAGVRLGAGMDKFGEYTRDGAVESQLEIEPGKHFPHPLGDFLVGGYFSWEIDVWKKLRNSKNAAVSRFLGSIEGKNFLTSQLVSEIAETYFELIALDQKREIINRNISIQEKALEVVKQQKEAARVSQLAINRFEAQLLNTKNLKFEVQQEIVLCESKINYLVGRFPQKITRDLQSFNETAFPELSTGVPSQLLLNRPDIRQAEQELSAARLDVKVAKANFLPQFSISANLGFNAFRPQVWFNPQSLLYNLVGDLMMPLLNRNGLKAQYIQANAQQNKAVYKYEQSILNGFTEVYNQLAGMDNFSKSYQMKRQEVDILNQSVDISNQLFSSARADYMEVLLTQRETIEASMELIEIRLKLLHAKVGLYRALGGGWR